MSVAPHEADHQSHPFFDRRRRTLLTELPAGVKRDRRRPRKRRSSDAA